VNLKGTARVALFIFPKEVEGGRRSKKSCDCFLDFSALEGATDRRDGGKRRKGYGIDSDSPGGLC
jgi:hypothetical protein